MEKYMENQLKAVALSIRSLSMDAIQKANSGHPGLPLGAAELAAALYGSIMRHNPKNPAWKNRDRFVLSAGHGSMLLYAILHLAGYGVSLDDIKRFRQPGSRCPGHPEYGWTPGVEMTTGPLGQGLSTAVGMALAESMLAAKYNEPGYKIVDHYTYVLAGEGCLMEGVASEASSFAGHNKLGKLIVFYDENHITIDGSTDIAFTEDIAKRYEAYGWQILRGDMYNIPEIEKLAAAARLDPRPSLIMLKSVIGKGAPTVAGTAKAHGAPLGAEGVAAAKKALGLDPEKDFQIQPEALEFFEKKAASFAQMEAEWNALFEKWAAEYPAKKKAWDEDFAEGGVSAKRLQAAVLPEYEAGASLATRTASNNALNAFAAAVPNLTGGSADLQGPNAVGLKGAAAYTPQTPDGRYIHFGIREFAMAAICNGIQLHGGFRAFCATFMVFADYLRPALRLSALMQQPVIYVLTHDSIYVGEDGPTHQPVETLASLRAIPNVRLFRPADAEETAVAWKLALQHTDGPVCLALSRQNLPVLEKDDPDWKHTAECGAYIVRKGGEKPDITILATGSEVEMAVRAAELVPEKHVRVVSVLSKELFESQPEKLIETILGGKRGVLRTVTAEAGVRMGWEGWTQNPADNFSINRFGESGPAKLVAEELGFTAEKLAALLK
ncbi:MAG: transketolase [Spirochaetes bacterium]|uniref:Transketolase n=1 Tax=Candidatus Avitreponema avistercoris TaxID=2840705 RepID=A0A9D9ERC5_9SPIR|nr:transketolase [Candidatus Avitreponema avistercoris]